MEVSLLLRSTFVGVPAFHVRYVSGFERKNSSQIRFLIHKTGLWYFPLFWIFGFTLPVTPIIASLFYFIVRDKKGPSCGLFAHSSMWSNRSAERKQRGKNWWSVSMSSSSSRGHLSTNLWRWNPGSVIRNSGIKKWAIAWILGRIL